MALFSTQSGHGIVCHTGSHLLQDPFVLGEPRVCGRIIYIETIHLGCFCVPRKNTPDKGGKGEPTMNRCAEMKSFSSDELKCGIRGMGLLFVMGNE